MEETISLQEIFETIKKRLAMIILIVILAVAASAVYSYFLVTPVYKANTQILVNQSQDRTAQSFTRGDIETNLALIKTYSVIMKSPTILQEVVNKLDLEQSASTLSKQMTVKSAEGSQVVNVSVKNTDPAQAVKIANTVAQVFQHDIVNLMNIDNVTILSKADLGAHPAPVSPNPKLNMAIAFILGLMIGIGLAFLLEYLDQTIKTEQDIEQDLGLPILGAVSEIPTDTGADTSADVSRNSRMMRSDHIES